MNESKSFSSALMRAVGHQFGQVVSHLRLLLLSGSVKEKLAKLILQWANDFGEETSEGTRIPNLLTHEEIAQIIGASRETVTRLLSTLRRKQIVKTNNGSLWILNWAALNSAARQF
jgi:CRP/FNR family transcriptional regulator